MEGTKDLVRFVNTIKEKSSFSFDEIFYENSLLKSEKQTIDRIIMFCPDEISILSEINALNNKIELFLNNGIIEREINTGHRIMYVTKKIGDDEVIFTNIITMIDTLSIYRYELSHHFYEFISNGYLTPKEVQDKKNSKQTFLKEWLPIIVAVAGLLISSIPSWVSLFTENKLILDMKNIPVIELHGINSVNQTDENNKLIVEEMKK
jgi:hypothetical protein